MIMGILSLIHSNSQLALKPVATLPKLYIRISSHSPLIHNKIHKKMAKLKPSNNLASPTSLEDLFILHPLVGVGGTRKKEGTIFI